MSAHASIAKYKGPMLLQVGLNDHVVWPEPAQAQGKVLFPAMKENMNFKL